MANSITVKVTIESSDFSGDDIGMPIYAPIRCEDGFTISVQANRFAYCTPRIDQGHHTHYECGNPSTVPLSTSFKTYAETTDYINTVYAYVPKNVLMEELALHGGIKQGGVPE